MKNIVIMKDKDEATVYSIKINRDKLLEVLEDLTLHCSRNSRGLSNQEFKKGVKTLFSKDGIKTNHEEKDRTCWLYEYSPIGKALYDFIVDPTKLKELDEAISNEKKRLETVEPNHKILYQELDYLYNIPKMIIRTEMGKMPSSNIPDFIDTLSKRGYDETKLVEGVVKPDSLLSKARNSIIGLLSSKKRI